MSIVYRRLNLDFSKYINIRNNKDKATKNTFIKEEIAVEREVNNLEELDSKKDELKKRDKKLKVKKKTKETSKSQTLDTNSLLKKKNDRNGIS